MITTAPGAKMAVSSRSRGTCVIVADPEDRLAVLVASGLRTRGVPIMTLPPETLTGRRVSLRGPSFQVEGAAVGAILFRASSGGAFSLGFRPDDRSFGDAETRAVWIAALSMDGMLAVNRHDATTWFEDSRWPAWRRQLAGLPWVPCRTGDMAPEPVVSGASTPDHNGSSADARWRWLPCVVPAPRPLPARRVIQALGASMIEGDGLIRFYAVMGHAIAVAREAQGVGDSLALHLAARGVLLAEAAVDQAGRLAWIDTLPVLTEAAAAPAASALVDAIAGHLAIAPGTAGQAHAVAPPARATEPLS